MKIICLQLLIFIVGIFSTSAQNYVDSLDIKLSALYDKSDLPGYCLSIVNNRGILYQQGFGFADKENQTPYTEKTIQPIASISKTLIGIAVMKSIEMGYFTLETNINDLLPFEVVNPNFPDDPIKIKHLATHTSGIVDKLSSYIKAYYLLESPDFEKNEYTFTERKYLKEVSKNQKMTLDGYLKEVLDRNGTLYNKGNFTKNKPGLVYEYSNLGAALAAYIVELVSNIPYDAYTMENIITPVGMYATSWEIEQSEDKHNAVLYSKNGYPLPGYSCSSYPDGGLRTSSIDLSRYLIEIISGYKGQGKVLSPESYQTMLTSQHLEHSTGKKGQYTNSGIFWEITKKGSLGHSGGYPGVTSLMFYSPDKEA